MANEEEEVEGEKLILIEHTCAQVLNLTTIIRLLLLLSFAVNE